MALKCPVPGCEDSEKEFQTETALKSYIRNIHPEYEGGVERVREVPIVEEDFATLLKKFKIRADVAANIAENISHTGDPKAFEDAEILLKRLSLWSSDIPRPSESSSSSSGLPKGASTFLRRFNKGQE